MALSCDYFKYSEIIPSSMGESKPLYAMKILSIGALAAVTLFTSAMLLYTDRLKERRSDNLSKHLYGIVLEDAVSSFFNVADTTSSEKADPLLDETYIFIRAYRESILSSAAKYAIPPEMIAAVLINENYPGMRSAYNDFGEDIGSIVHKNISLGPGQIKINTAIMLDRYHGRRVEEYGEYLDILQIPEKNIAYIAEYLDFLKKRTRPNEKEKLPTEMSADELLMAPDYFMRILSGYVSGRVPRTSINLYGWAVSDQIADLSIIMRGDSSLYMELHKIYTKDQAEIRNQISYIFEQGKHTWDAPIRFQ